MTPNARAARLHLADAADALRTASERLCDWLEATGQDVAGNGHVASADEAAGSLREAPTAPVSSSLPPIPLGAVVTVTVNGVEWQREDGEWDDAEGGGPPNKADALDFLDRIAELEREVHLARNDEALALSTSREWESYCKRAERERDEARREAEEASNREACSASDAREWRAACERAERERDEARRRSRRSPMPDASERVSVTDTDVDYVLAVLRARHGDNHSVSRDAVLRALREGWWPLEEYRAVAAVALAAAQAENARLREDIYKAVRPLVDNSLNYKHQAQYAWEVLQGYEAAALSGQDTTDHHHEET